jgi:3-oxoacyl-[acyl-carrier protein] reductase
MKRQDFVLTSIRNKSVIVTGGTKGIGKGIAGVFAQLGARVCVLGRNEPDGAATVKALRGRGSTAIFCRGDVKEQGDMEEVMATVAAEFGGVDILCANAGIFPPVKLEEMSESAWDAVFSTNLKGYAVQHQSRAAPLKEKCGGPHRAHLVHHGSPHGLPWLVALWGNQSRDVGIHAHCRH